MRLPSSVSSLLSLSPQKKDRLCSFADQGFQGMANLGVNALLARSLIKNDFASIGLTLGVYFFVLGLHRAAVSVPFILNMGRQDADGRKADAWWWFNLLFVVLIMVLLWGLGEIVRLVAPPSEAWVVRAMAYAAMVTPALCFTEFGRRWLYYKKKSFVAAVAAGVYFLINVVIASIVLITGAGLALGMATWVLAAAGYLTIVIWAAPPAAIRPSSVIEVWKPHIRFTGWQMLNHLPYTIYNNSVVILIGFFGGPIAAAIFTAARTLSSPILSVGAAVDLLDKPRAAQALATQGIAGLRNSIGRTRRLLLLFNGIYLAIVLLLTHPMLELAFGSRYLDHQLEVQLLAFGFFLFGLNQPSETLLIILHANRALLTTRCAAMVCAIASLAVLTRLYGAIGCAGAIVCVQLVNIIGLRWAEHIAISAYEKNAERATATSAT